MSLPHLRIVLPCIWDEGSIDTRPCTIHPNATHVHQAVCHECRQPLTADLQPAFCFHTPATIGWTCMFDPSEEPD